MIHLKELHRFPNLVVNHEIKDLNSQVLKLIKNTKKFNKKKINNILNFFLTPNAANYSKSLDRCLKEIT